MNSFFGSIRSVTFRRGPARIVGGVAGGIAASTGINVWIVRILLLLASMLPVVGVGLYALVWALTPWQDGTIPAERALGGR